MTSRKCLIYASLLISLTGWTTVAGKTEADVAKYCKLAKLSPCVKQPGKKAQETKVDKEKCTYVMEVRKCYEKYCTKVTKSMVDGFAEVLKAVNLKKDQCPEVLADSSKAARPMKSALYVGLVAILCYFCLV